MNKESSGSSEHKVDSKEPPYPGDVFLNGCGDAV